MCSEPMLTPDGKPFACRKCDECSVDRLNQWTARAVAEAAYTPYTMSVTLTYNEDTQQSRDGAKMFRYSDVSKFLMTLRRQVQYHLGRTGAVRFIACGETGDRLGRCHWHIILYSEVDFLTLGKFTFQGRPVSRDDIITEHGGIKKRRHWSLWPHGFVVVQEPDEGGLRYALSYALKDQFSFGKSKGTKRYERAETYPVGFFRMSKRPPIGRIFLDHTIAQLDASNSVLPRMALRVPNYSWPWYVHGSERRYLLTRLIEINDRVRAETGQDAPQWGALLKSLENSTSDMELINGPQNDTDDPNAPDYHSVEQEFSLRQRETERRYADRETARRCGSRIACKACLRSVSEAERQAYGVSLEYDAEGREVWSHPEGFDRLSGTTGGAINPLCQLKDVPDVARVFPHSSKV